VNVKTNKILARMREGQRAYGYSLNFPSPTVIELMGQADFDYVWLDGEHGPFTPGTLEELCRVADLAGVTPIARVPDISSATILRFLDRGIMGIQGPHIRTGEEAQALADACRFAPIGKRSFGYGLRSVPPSTSVPEFMAQLNAQVLIIAMIEDVEAIEKLPDLLSVDGIDLFTVGAFDLSQSMGVPGESTHPAVMNAVAEVEKQVHAAGRKMVSDVMMATSATGLLLEGARAFLNQNKTA
jgi:2-keto-3-deoxy-L-rhamnonate aldolase RhmA